MRRLASALLAAAALLGSAARAEIAPAVEIQEIDGGRLVTLGFPGSVRDTADACYDERCHGLLILIRSDHRRLFLYDPADPDALALLEAQLPPRADALAVADVDADGRVELLVGEPGRLHRIGTIRETIELHAPKLLIESANLDLGRLVQGGFLEPGRVVVPELGALKIYTVDAAGATLATEHELPLRARREPTGLRLFTYPVRRLEVYGRTLFAVGPESHGHHRLRTVLIDPEAGVEPSAEVWSWLPEAESVTHSWYAALDGRAALVVTTVRADRMGIFEKKKLRVFSLRAGDRSRAGSRPSLKADTASRRWHEAAPEFVDVDGDGRRDLVLVQPEGMGGKKLVVEAYLGRGNAQFHALALRSVVPARFAASWRYGVDVDGDGARDLVTRSEQLIQVFRGSVDAKKSQILEKKPWRVLDLAGVAPPGGFDTDESGQAVDWGSWRVERRLAVRDLDLDGRAEILVSFETGELSLVRIVAGPG